MRGIRGAVGALLAESLPNIKGGFLSLYDANGVSGDFKYTDKTGVAAAVGGGYTTKFVEIDNPTYQDNAPVQQNALVCCFCIKY